MGAFSSIQKYICNERLTTRKLSFTHYIFSKFSLRYGKIQFFEMQDFVQSFLEKLQFLSSFEKNWREATPSIVSKIIGENKWQPLSVLLTLYIFGQGEEGKQHV